MGINRYASKKDTNQDAIVKALRQAGASVYIASGKGIPDLIVGIHSVTLLAETKNRYGKLTPAQIEFHDNWKGGKIYILKSIDDAINMLNEITP